MGKIKEFFRKTGVALGVLAASIIGVIKLTPPLANGSVLSEGLTIAAGLVCTGVVMIGCGIGKAIQVGKEKKLLKEANGPAIEKPKETAAKERTNSAKNTNTGNNDFGQKMGQTAEKIGEKINEGANRLGVKLEEIFGNGSRPNTSANPYSSTVNNGSNPYSSKDRMSAGQGGTYNGKQYGSSYTGDVRGAQQMGNTGYYSGGQNSYNNNYYNNNNNRNNQNNRNPYNQNNRNGQNGYNNGYQNNNNRYNNQYNNQNVQYGGGAGNRPNNGNYNNQNVQYGNYANGGNNNRNNTGYSQNTKQPNTSGLEESAKSNYFDNEPGSSSYRSGPLKKEKI